MKKVTLDYTLKVYLPITVLVVLTVWVATYFVSRDERYGVGYQPEQPIKYSHQLHAGEMKIDCQYCHTMAAKGRHSNVPAASTCMGCHAIARKDKPEIIKLTKFYNEGNPIPWKRVHRLPEHVYFNHSVHINKGLQCTECHGNIAGMEKVQQMKPFNMADCLGCHRTAHEKFPHLVNQTGLKKGPQHCGACHR